MRKQNRKKIKALDKRKAVRVKRFHAIFLTLKDGFMDSTKQESKIEVLKETQDLRVTWAELADKLTKERQFELNKEESLVIHQMDSSDLLSAIEESEGAKRLGVLIDIMKRYCLELSLEGSINFGAFNLADHSWTITPGDSGFLRISAKPTAVRKSLSEIVSFLSKIPTGQALVLKPLQELFLEDISASDMLNYYEYCQEEQDPAARELEQDALFAKSCPTLVEKDLTLKIYGLNAKQIDRNLDTNIGGILFKPVGSAELTHPRLVIALFDKKAK